MESNDLSNTRNNCNYSKMKTYEIFTATFSKLIKAIDKDSAKIAFEQMFKDAEIIQIKEYDFMGERDD